MVEATSCATAVCRNCAEDFHFYVRADTKASAHCEPCSNISSSRSITITILFLCFVCAALGLLVLSTFLPPWAKERQWQLFDAITNVYRLCVCYQEFESGSVTYPPRLECAVFHMR